MKIFTHQAFQSCLFLTYGLIAGWSVFFYRPIDCRLTGLGEGVAFFISNVLFNGLLAGILTGAALSGLVFPLNYFIIKRFNKIIALIFLGVGFAAGSIFPAVILSLFRQAGITF